MIHDGDGLGWRGLASRLWILFPDSGDDDRPAGRPVAADPTGPECSLLDREDGLAVSRVHAAER